MKSKIFFLMLLVAAIATGCSKDDDDNGTPARETATGGTMSVTVVFAPGQLGDMGFADKVLEGVYRLQVLDHQAQPDTLDVNYLAGTDLDAAKEMVEDWFDDAYNDYTGKLYERRLLVLTEPFMVDWVEPLKERFNEWDEVLVLKMNQDDVTQAAARLGLGSRLHGLNISAASSVRRYCQYIRQSIEKAAEEQPDEESDKEPLNCNEIFYFRLYEPDQVTPRDSTFEVLSEEMGSTSDIVFVTMATTVGDGIFSDDGQTSILEESYKYGQMLTEQYKSTGEGFHVADLGSAAQGMSYYFMNNNSAGVRVLMLDTQLSSQLWVRRDFGTALYRWATRWMRADALGTLPAAEEFGGWNSNYVTDNIQLLDE